MRKIIIGTLAAAAVTLAGQTQAADLDIEITNLTHGFHFTPLLVGAHGAGSHLFQAGQDASDNLQIMAECGMISGLSADLDNMGANKVENPAGGMLAPGATTPITSLMTTDGNTYLSLVAMLLPTNDAFVGIDNVKIPTAAGTYTYYLNAYDAGTEANNELIDASGCAAGMAGIPGAPGEDTGTGGMGVTDDESNKTVHVHRGTLGDTEATGGKSDLNSSIHRWQNPVARLVITVK
jgi:hypothetical protein